MNDKKALLDHKLEELIALLEHSKIDIKEAQRYKDCFNNAIEKNIRVEDQLSEYARLDDEDLSRLDMLNELGNLLKTTQLDSRSVREYKKREWLTRSVTFLIGLVLMALGFAMIILPAPPSFEIYTLFYLNANDGVTIMDVISLLIVLTGVFVTITALKKKQ